MKALLTVDLSVDRKFDSLLEETLDRISRGSDRLKENYQDIDPREFACFSAVIKDNQIICFSTLQLEDDKWGKGIGRCSSRLWIDPDYRIQGLSKWSGGERFLNTTYCVPMQIQRARDLKLDCLFVSRDENLKGFQEYIKLLKINCDLDFQLEKRKYNIGGDLKSIPENCKHYVALLSLTERGKYVWDMAMWKHKLVFDEII